MSLCIFFFFLMIRRPPRSTRTDTLFPYTTLFRSMPILILRQILGAGQLSRQLEYLRHYLPFWQSNAIGHAPAGLAGWVRHHAWNFPEVLRGGGPGRQPERRLEAAARGGIGHQPPDRPPGRRSGRAAVRAGAARHGPEPGRAAA